MRRSGLISAMVVGLAALVGAGCTTTSPAFHGYDRTVTSSISPRAAEQAAKQRYSGMVTNDRTGYVTRRVEPKPMF